VDTAFHLQQAGSGKSMLSSLYGYIPLIKLGLVKKDV